MATTNSTTTNSIDPLNPLYLHPSDHPGMLLVSKSFDGIGFGAWKRAMTIALSAKNKLGFVTGEITKPNDPIQQQLWQRCNDMVISWILNTLSKEISESVLYTQTVHQLWNELHDRYGQANGAKLYQLQKNLCEISQGNDNIATYFTKVKSNWDELNALSGIPPCTCGHSTLIAKREEQQRLVQFLMGLNPAYDVVRGNILMMNPLPSISQAYALLVQDEKQKEIHASGQFNLEAASMNVYNNVRTNQNAKSDVKKIVCTHCKRSGHSVDKCYRIIGFPKEFKFTKTKRSAANASYNESDGDKNVSSTAGLTQEQYNGLLQFLLKTQVNTSEAADASVNSATFAGPFTEEASGSW
ncbi:putative transcription factor interactor and regulator CCHC(Zn) family [Helianthus annuus]|nr:putative transcription factor interactor and regulator CCHC(Zn) family [Helianthus annuus]